MGPRNIERHNQILELRQQGFGCRVIGKKLGIRSCVVSKYLLRMPKPEKYTAIHVTPLEQMLIKNSPHRRANVKTRLISSGLLKQECAVCGLGPIWNGQKLVLRLDHINGVNNDYRLWNLRLLCPNCDSQTETYCGRNKKIAPVAQVASAPASKAGNVGSTPTWSANGGGTDASSVWP